MMNSSNTPKDLNWVQARVECSLLKVFQSLQAGVQSDVNDMQPMLPTDGRIRLEFNIHNVNTFSVSRIDSSSGFVVGESVVFNLSAETIDVHLRDNKENRKLFSAAITLDDDGNCKLKVGENSLEQWQVRRTALERLFFGPR
jgi:hypothetical protein